MELQPESDTQPAIVPTQLILHSVAAPWTPRRMFEYWRDSTNLEPHFGLGFDGALAQYVGTQTRADANMHANRRPDGTGAVSVETASNLQHTDPWTDAQVEALIGLGVWMHRQHGIPLRVCRTWDDPGFGVHRMFPQWSDGGTACPGDARVRQFHEVIFPAIVARAAGQTTPTTSEEDLMTDAQYRDVMSGIGQLRDMIAGTPERVWAADVPRVDGAWAQDPNRPTVQAGWLVAGIAPIQYQNAALQAELAAQAAVLQTLLDGYDGVDTEAVLAAIAAVGAQAAKAVEQALAAGVDVDVRVGNTTTKEN
jgi:hypothetical protein